MKTLDLENNHIELYLTRVFSYILKKELNQLYLFMLCQVDIL